MKKLIAWTIDNTPAMNTLMIAIMAVGGFLLYSLNREMFPNFELEMVVVSVPYPGAAPAEVEEGICQKIEEAVSSIEGVKKINSVAREGMGSVIVELQSGIGDVQKPLNEIDSAVNRIPSFPELAEKPTVEQITMRKAAIELGVTGPEDPSLAAEVTLRDLAEKLRTDLKSYLSSKGLVPAVDILGGRPYQIDIEIPERTLREYGLTLQDVASIVRNQNLELPSGTIRTESREVLLRGKNKRMVGEELEEIVLVTQPDGVVLTVGDLGTVRDAFTDTTAITRIDGKPGLILSVSKTASEDLLAITDACKEFVETADLPPGYQLTPFADESHHVRDRLNLLLRNGAQGLVLVFLLLAVFLELRLASWVALGIPISILGSGLVLFPLDQTLNMLSMFAFILTLGILVDDAIVVGENVYHHRGEYVDYRTAAIIGTAEVLPSITASVSTTIIAFTPMLFVPGIFGKFIFIIPIAVIAMLAMSLFECTFILPCHLAHEPKEQLSKRFESYTKTLPPIAWGFAVPIWGLLIAIEFMLYPLRWLYHMTRRINHWSTEILNTIAERAYLPLLKRLMAWPTLVVACGIAILMIGAGAFKGGYIPMEIFPSSDSPVIEASIAFPEGTSAAVTDNATRHLEESLKRLNERIEKETGKPFLKLVYRLVGSVGTGSTQIGNESPDGSNRGRIVVELVEPAKRAMQSQEIIDLWRKEAGPIAGIESLEFEARAAGPGGKTIEFRICGQPEDMPRIEKAIEECKARLASYAGVRDISDDSAPGKPEFQIRVKDDAQAMGVTERDLAGTIRAAYYGEEVMRLQRGRHEVKLMVRYPLEERRSLSNFDDLRVRTGDASERPVTELADITHTRGYSQITRLNERRCIAITADASPEAKTVAVKDMKEVFLPELLAKPEFQGLVDEWGGQQEEFAESMQGLFLGLAIALVVMFGLLTFEFKSYAQPLIIMCIIPFGMIGAVLGHLVMGMYVTIMSVFGLVALTGVVVNDSIVLIDFINHRVHDGLPIKEALLDAGRRRLRPVLLTSLTTILGLTPLLLETSFQAQFLIPMAVSLCFGLMVSTFLILLFVPTFYLIYYRLSGGHVSAHSGIDAGDSSGGSSLSVEHLALPDAPTPGEPDEPLA